MTSNPPDSHEISLKIIEAVKQHPVLYIPEVKGHTIKLQEFRQKVWKRISDELRLDSSWVKLKWKNLKDTYSRIVKFKNKSPRGLRRKKWIFEDQLNFLKFPYEPDYQDQFVQLSDEYIKDINSEIISSQDILEQLDEETDDDDYSEYLEVLEQRDLQEIFSQETGKNFNNDNLPENIEIDIDSSNTQTLQQQAIDAYAKQIQSKFRKIMPKESKVLTKSPNLAPCSVLIKSPAVGIVHEPPTVSQQPVRKIMKFSPPNNNFDYKGSIDQFFASMAQAVKKLPPKAQADIKMDVCRIVSEAEIRHSRQSSPSSMLKYTNMPGMIPKMVLVPCRAIDNQNN